MTRAPRRRRPTWTIVDATGARVAGGCEPDWWDTSRPAEPEGIGIPVTAPLPVSALVPPLEFRWASETGAHALAHPEELEYLGYRRVRPDPRYPTTWLLVRELPR
jgi:hypothetical protein